MRLLLQLWRFGVGLDILMQSPERRVTIWFGLHGWYRGYRMEIEFYKQPMSQKQFHVHLPWLHLNNNMMQHVEEEWSPEIGGTRVVVKSLISGKIFGKVIGAR